jgi:hypothetical protein
MANTQYSINNGVIQSILVTGQLTLTNLPGATTANLTTLAIGSSVTSIGNGAFQGCTILESVIIGTLVQTIDTFAFYNCTKLASINIPNSVRIINNFAFYNCTSLTSITIKNGVTNIGSNTFGCCTLLASVIIPDSVTNIASSAFAQCTSLAEVTMGTGVTSIGGYVFEYCANLAYMTFGGPLTTANIGNGIVDRIGSNDTRKITFLNTNSATQINPILLAQIKYITNNDTVSNTGPQIFFTINATPTPTPTITNFSIPTKTFGISPFTITQPTSNSFGSFIYSSSNLEVATISGTTITVVGVGNATITATQAETTTYNSGTSDALFQVIENTPSNPADISSGLELHYVLTTNAEYGGITNNLIVTSDLINTGETQKTLINMTNDVIYITKL